LKRDDFLRQFLGGQAERQKGKIEGDVLMEWTQRMPIQMRLLYVLGPVLLLLGYYAFKYFRGARFSPLDVVISFFLFVFGSRLAGAARKYSLTSVGVYELAGTNWRPLGKWNQFESCRREEHAIILTKRKGYPRTVSLKCADRQKMLRILALANEQISRHRWK
jgi:hypothetical protein